MKLIIAGPASRLNFSDPLMTGGMQIILNKIGRFCTPDKV